jgi:hypothetical protein
MLRRQQPSRTMAGLLLLFLALAHLLQAAPSIIRRGQRRWGNGGRTAQAKGVQREGWSRMGLVGVAEALPTDMEVRHTSGV